MLRGPGHTNLQVQRTYTGGKRDPGSSGGHENHVTFFFSSRRRHTRLTCDWSSDVCSSDLSAAANTGVSAHDGAPATASPTTTAGPIAYHPSPSASATVKGGRPPRSAAPSARTTCAPATTIGTYAGGRRKSIGTKTSCTGDVRPSSTSNSTVRMATSSTPSPRALTAEKPVCGSANATAAAATTNATTTASSVQSSRRLYGGGTGAPAGRRSPAVRR